MLLVEERFRDFLNGEISDATTTIALEIAQWLGTQPGSATHDG